MMNKFCSPLRYPGGKSCIFPFVSELFYENEIIGIEYAEPYAGGAGLALRLLFEEYVSTIHINDFDKSIHAFWNTILNYTEEFCSWVKVVDVNIENWQNFKEIQRNPLKYNDFELAKSTFFLNRTNISGVIKGGVIGGVDQKGKYKINARFNKDDLIKRIKRIALFKDRIYLSNLDGVDFIKKINKQKTDCFIYLDPPYYLKGADLYMNYYLKKDHEKLATQIEKIRKKWMISYDKNDFILNLYNKQRKVTYQLSQCTSNKTGNEVIIFSDELKFKKSTEYLKSPLILPNIKPQ